MKLIVFHFILWLVGSACCYHVPGCCVEEFPLKHHGETIISNGETCPASSPQRDEALNRINSEIDELIDSVLYRVQNSLLPSPCKGPGWRQVVNLDMRSPCSQCPSTWNETVIQGKKLCARNLSPYSNCQSSVFPTDGNPYSQVCGRIVGYQFSSTEAFSNFHNNGNVDIDGAYVDGVSVTHGNPREHIWTFAAGSDEQRRTNGISCPCLNFNININIPSFIDGDYFCESGVSDLLMEGNLFPDDPLWDGEGCGANSQCCEFNTPPWFSKTLPQPTSDAIEVRICAGNREEDVPIELIELYVM